LNLACFLTLKEYTDLETLRVNRDEKDGDRSSGGSEYLTGMVERWTWFIQFIPYGGLCIIVRGNDVGMLSNGLIGHSQFWVTGSKFARKERPSVKFPKGKSNLNLRPSMQTWVSPIFNTRTTNQKRPLSLRCLSDCR
jgi:hypothetical protein